MLREVEQHRRALEHTRAAAVRVDERGDASIRVDREEPWLLLLARAQVELVDAAMYMRVCVNSACIS